MDWVASDFGLEGIQFEEVQKCTKLLLDLLQSFYLN
jgi:hypothetical protein